MFDKFLFVFTILQFQFKILGIRDFHCEHCGKAFYIEFNLKRHVATQHEGLRFKCDQVIF